MQDVAVNICSLLLWNVAKIFFATEPLNWYDLAARNVSIHRKCGRTGLDLVRAAPSDNGIGPVYQH